MPDLKSTTRRILAVAAWHNRLSFWQRKELASIGRRRKLSIRYSELLGRDVFTIAR